MHVERHSLTVRTFMKRFARLSLGFSKNLDNLAVAVSIYLAYYNSCWRPRRPDTSGQKRLMPALAGGMTDRLWRFNDLFDEVEK